MLLRILILIVLLLVPGEISPEQSTTPKEEAHDIGEKPPLGRVKNKSGIMPGFTFFKS